MSSNQSESWRKVWRIGFLPCLSDAELLALLAGLRADDHRILQGSTTMPPALQRVRDWPCEGGCVLVYAAMVADGLKTIEEAEERFAQLCFEADQALEEPAGCRWFLNWYDDTPRDQLRRELSAEIEYNLQTRRVAVPTATAVI